MVRRFAAAVTVAAAVLPAAGSSSASAAGSGTSAGATGSGDSIISQILGGHRGSANSGTGTGEAPRCHWRILTDSELLFVFHVAAARPELVDAPLFLAIAPHLELGLQAGFDIQVRICDGVVQESASDVRAVPSPIGSGSAAANARSRMLTQLPAPIVEASPPLGADVLLHQPVFHSIAESQWNQTVTSQLAAHGSVVEVRARPASVELASLESGAAGVIHHCSGRGLPFDPNSDDSPLAQASEPGACTLTYAAPTGVDGNRDRWYGYVLVNWDGAYRVNGGEWIDLDGLFSVRYFQRSVRELGAVLRGATRSRTQR